MATRKTTGTRTYPKEGRARVVIAAVRPEVDGGRFPAKGVVGDEVTIEADKAAQELSAQELSTQNLPGQQPDQQGGEA